MRPAAAKGALVIMCILGTPQNAPAQERPLPVMPIQDELVLLALSINGEIVAGDYLIARRGSDYLMAGKDLATLRIDLPAVPPIAIEGQEYVPLSAIAGLHATLDDARQMLRLTIPPGAFVTSRVSARAPRRAPTDATLATYLNYDLTVQYDDDTPSVGAFLDVGMSDDWGLVSSTAIIGNGAVYGRATRLDSYYLRDDPDTLTRLVIGDTVSDARDWTRQFRFGGIRLGTEFGLQPDLVTFPTPAFSGRASVPSNVELLVNEAARFQTDVDQGPFSINQVPLVTGAGDVTLVVRNPLGIEQRVRSSYYVSSRLLRPGLNAWSAEGGAQRRGYGVRSFSYYDPFVAGTFRRGMSQRMTLESRAQASGALQMMGGGLIFVLPTLGEFSVAAAASHGEGRSGTVQRVAFSRITPRWNIAASYQRASEGYRELGAERPSEHLLRQVQGSAGVALGGAGSIGIVYSDLRYADGNHARVGTATYSVGIADRAYINIFAIRSHFQDVGPRTTLGLSVTVPIDSRSSAYVQADSDTVVMEARRAPPTQGGWGYRASAGFGDTQRQQADIEWRGAVGEVGVQAARYDGDVGLRATATGGLLWAGGVLAPTRRVEGAFGVVEVPGQADVRIYQENREVARTGRNGRAIIADLIPYQENRIALAPADLPLDVAMPSDRAMVVPRYRSAVLARFAVERDHPGTVLLSMPDGRPMDAGTNVVAGTENAFVGYGGAVFLRNLRDGLVVEVDAADGPCRVVLGAMPIGVVLPRIGPLPCRAVTP